MNYDVIIAGGGLAGCGAAIHLACRGHRVLLLERKRYPVHKLCGEFLSGEAARSLDEFGILERVRGSGAQAIERVVLNDCHGRRFACDLPRPSLGISRYRLDSLLWQRAIEAGADCQDGVCVRAIHGDLLRGFCVDTTAGQFEARVVLAAHGKRAKLDRALGRSNAAGKAPLVAFKAHFRGCGGDGAIEMYGFPGGYCGVSPIEEGLVNVCWIAHENALAAAGRSVEGMVARALTRNPALARRLEQLRPASKFQGISNVVLGAKGTFAGDICLIGDAAGMIAPLCGDGMAMALRSAEIAAPLVLAFLAGDADAPHFKAAYTRSWEREFGMRLAIGRWANAAGFSPALAHLSLGVLRTVPGFGRWLIENTRG